MKDIIDEIQEINKEKDDIDIKNSILEAKISKHENNIKLLNYGSKLIYSELILLSILLLPILPIKVIITLLLFFYLATKAALTIAFGTKKGNNKKRIKFNNTIDENEIKKDILTKRINDIKENVRTYNENRERSINNNSLDNKVSYNTNKYKKRILRFKKEKSMAI